YELYLKGRYYWNKRTAVDVATAISYFNQAITKDPGYALAYAGLADSYSVLPTYRGTPSEYYPKSNAAARKALELDPSLARPHAVLGANEMEYDWDFAGGEAEYKKALQLDPNDATAHSWYAQDIALLGRDVEAVAEINHAHQLDPLSPIISANIGGIYLLARKYDEALVACRKATDQNPTFAQAHACLVGAYWVKRMYPQMIEELKIFGQLNGDPNEIDFDSAMERGFRSGGWKGALTKGIEAREAQRKAGYSSPYNIAGLYAELGDKDQAFRWLDTAYQERDINLVGLKIDFSLDPLRSDPRFAELVRKVGLPQYRRRLLLGDLPALLIVGVALIALAPAKQPIEKSYGSRGCIKCLMDETTVAHGTLVIGQPTLDQPSLCCGHRIHRRFPSLGKL